MTSNRRNFIKQMSALAAGTGFFSSLPFQSDALTAKKAFFEISLAEWSLHKTLFSKKINNLDFPGIAKKEFCEQPDAG